MKINKELRKEMERKEFEEFSNSKYFGPFVICVFAMFILIAILIIMGAVELIKFIW